MSVRLAIICVALLVSFAYHSASAQSVTRKTFTALQDIQKLVEADQPREAQVLLEGLVANTQELPYDNAIANQYLAHTSVMLDQPDKARRALKNALDAPDLPVDLRTELNLFYGTVLLGAEEFREARNVLEEWLAVEQFPKPSQLFSVAYANYKIDELARAEPLLERAIEMHDAPPDSWYQIYYRVLFDQKKHSKARTLLHQMLTRDPKNKMLWRMLANHHLQLERNRDALAAIMIAYVNELVTEPNELQQLVSMFSYMEIPDKGARLLEQWLKSGELEANAETTRQLGNLWLMARERKNAKAALANAAKFAPDGRTYELLAGLHFEDEEWPEAYTYFQQALQSGNLSDAPRVALLAGISASRAGRKEDARKALRVAAETSAYRREANSLLRELDKK